MSITTNCHRDNGVTAVWSKHLEQKYCWLMAESIGKNLAGRSFRMLTYAGSSIKRLTFQLHLVSFGG